MYIRQPFKGQVVHFLAFCFIFPCKRPFTPPNFMPILICNPRLAFLWVANIDVILGGHSHTFMKGPKTYLNMDGEEVAVMHTGKSGVRVGRLDLTLEHK